MTRKRKFVVATVRVQRTIELREVEGSDPNELQESCEQAKPFRTVPAGEGTASAIRFGTLKLGNSIIEKDHFDQAWLDELMGRLVPI